VARSLKENGLQEFCIECVELNPKMLKRGYDLAKEEGVLEHMSFIEQDFNEWKPDKEYISVVANQSLHHVSNLEGLFSGIKAALNDNGAFIISDMIGRNGHQRWPEALSAVNNFWKELPESYKYNHQLRRHEEVYENWDCSTEGFEGIRAQDILPLLVDNFFFSLFIGFANVVDVFIDRGFGPNFSIFNRWDTAFIDRIHEFDEHSIRSGALKPTHMMAVMKKNPVENPEYSRGFSPEYCIRDPSFQGSLKPSKAHAADARASRG
jgi:SAM-dependent methyltransferase